MGEAADSYLVTQLYKMTLRSAAAHVELIEAIRVDESVAGFKRILETSWKNKERDIERLFNEVQKHVNAKQPLDTYLQEVFQKMLGGDFFGDRLPQPWDFTLSAFNYGVRE